MLSEYLLPSVHLLHFNPTLKLPKQVVAYFEWTGNCLEMQFYTQTYRDFIALIWETQKQTDKQVFFSLLIYSWKRVACEVFAVMSTAPRHLIHFIKYQKGN